MEETLSKQKIADILYSHIKQMMGLCYISQNDIPDIAEELLAELKSQPVTAKTEQETVPVLSDLSEADKTNTIDSFIRLTAKHTLQLFMMLGLKTHITAKVKNDATNEEFEFTFKKIEQETNEKNVEVEKIILSELQQQLNEYKYVNQEHFIPTSKEDSFTISGRFKKDGTEQRISKYYVHFEKYLIDSEADLSQIKQILWQNYGMLNIEPKVLTDPNEKTSIMLEKVLSYLVSKKHPIEQEKEVTDNDIYLWAENEYGCSGTQSIACKRDVNIAIRGAKAMRDGKIKPNE